MTQRITDRATPWLVFAAVLATALGLGMSRFVAGPNTDPWPGLWQRAFGPDSWRFLIFATLGFGGLALVLSVFMSLRGRAEEQRRRRFNFEGLGEGSVRDALLEVQSRIQQCMAGHQPDVAVALDELIRGALGVEASDIHMNPQDGDLIITYRIHGSLFDVCLLPEDAGKRLVTRVKVLALLDPYARRPQDGRLQRDVSGVRMDARVSTLPADGGHRVVLRLVRGAATVPELGALGFDTAMSGTLEELLGKPQGLLLVTGPVGSGKTTTLYSSLEHISRSRGRTTTLVTLEDPIELQLPFATQTQINAAVGMSFAHTLRSVLRQDPNVLMLGEIRDPETAEIAAQAALTGHLLLTTVHAHTAAGAFARIIEMGVEPFILASAAIGSLSQRLVRTLCTNCRRQVPPDPLVTERFRRLGVPALDGTFYEPSGCEHCEGQGYTGRTPIAELLVVTPELRSAIHQRLPTEQIHQLAADCGMVSLLESGLGRARGGITSLSEVLRVVG